MKYIYSCQTDIGTTRNTNQDSLIVKSISNQGHTALLAAVCDGVGGLSQGEAASRRVADMMATWADYELPQILVQTNVEKVLKHRFRQLILDINRELYYGNQRTGISSGTTLTAILLWNYRYLIGHVGDSRIYSITASQAWQITPDHSWVAREVEAGRMTKEQALVDSRQNVILRCIGVNVDVEPYMKIGSIEEPVVMVLCTDGFWHHVEEKEWRLYFSPTQVTGERVIGAHLYHMVEQVKYRGEKDNITAIVIRIF